MLDLLAWGFGLITALITTNIYLVMIGPVVTYGMCLRFVRTGALSAATGRCALREYGSIPEEVLLGCIVFTMMSIIMA